MKKIRFPTYFFDFFAVLIKDHNIPMAIYLLLNAALGIFILASIAANLGLDNGMALAVSGGIYLVMLMVIYSPIGEAVLRWQVSASGIPAAEAARLQPLFDKVITQAKRVNPNLDEKISLFMIQSDEMNAAAVGRRTIVINSATLALPNDQLAGILTHEVGHLSHKDTDLLLAVIAGNGVVNLGFLAMRLVINLLTMVVNLFAGGGAVAIFGLVFSLLAKLITLIMDLSQRFWIFIGKLAMNWSSRRQELRADEFSVNCGAGLGLSRFLTFLLEQQGGQQRRNDVLASFMSSHPETRSRLKALADLGVPVERPDLLID